MTRPPVIALWLDSAEPEILERLLAAGALPHMARLRAEGAYGRLHSVRFGVTEVSYAMLGTGCWPSTMGYWQQCAFEPATYSGRLAGLVQLPVLLGQQPLGLSQHARPPLQVLRLGQ